MTTNLLTHAQPQVMTSGKFSWRVAQDHEESQRCNKCDGTFPLGVMDQIFLYTYDCPSCGSRVYAHDNIKHLMVRAEAVPYFDEDYARNAIWYHATSYENWFETAHANRKMVHLGTHESAIDRFEHKKFEGGNWFLYALKMRPGADLSPVVVPDDDSVAPEVYNHIGSDKNYMHRVTRYVNAYEAPGSISLVAALSEFEQISVVPLPI